METGAEGVFGWPFYHKIGGDALPFVNVVLVLGSWRRLPVFHFWRLIIYLVVQRGQVLCFLLQD
jgi:hypothetical protein